MNRMDWNRRFSKRDTDAISKLRQSLALGLGWGGVFSIRGLLKNSIRPLPSESDHNDMAQNCNRY